MWLLDGLGWSKSLVFNGLSTAMDIGYLPVITYVGILARVRGEWRKAISEEKLLIDQVTDEIC